MARKINNLAEVKVYINGKEQAKRDLAELTAQAEKLNEEITALKKKEVSLAKDPQKVGEYNDARKERLQAENEYKKLQKVIRETKKFTEDIEEDLNNLSGQSLARLKVIERSLMAIRQKLDPNDDKDGDFLAFLNENLKRVADTIKQKKGDIVEFSDIMDDLTNIDDTSLAKAEQRLKSLLAATDKDDIERIKQLKDELKQVQEIKDTRTMQKGEEVISQVKAGSFKGTIAETEEAIKNVKEYQRVMKDTSPEKVKEVEDTFKSLNESLARAKSEMLSFEDAMKQAKQVSDGTWDGTQEDLEKLKRSLEYFKKNKLQFNADSERLKDVNNALKDIEKTEKGAMMTTQQFEKLLGNLDKATPEQLQLAAKELQERFNKARQGTAEYVKTAAKLRDVNKRILEVNRSLREQENVIVRTAKRLASYVLVYAGFNEVVGYIKRLTQANLELSDSLADIQKTTGLSEAAVGRLSDQINAIDTRTAQKELHDLAYEAGKLGISAEEDVLSFVKAGNQLLVALGEDLGGAEAVRQLMKVNAILGETEKLGIEKALLSTGSAINEVSQTSRASAGPIADMVSRMGAIGSAAGLSMADLIALAGTADSLGQSAEVAATAFNKFISTLTSNPVDVAYALGMDPDQIQKQLDAGNTMAVIQEIFTKMSTMGNMADLAPIMGELGSEGARMTQVLVTMAKGVGELNAQVYTSKKAFQEATSVTNEYNIKNESAAAILQRMGNNMRESVVKSGFVSWLQDVLKWLADIPNALERNVFWLNTLRVAWWQLITLLSVRTLKATWGGLVTLFTSLSNSLKAMYAEAARAALGLNSVTKAAQITTLRKLALAGVLGKVTLAFRVLWGVIAANPLGAIAVVVTTAVVAIQNLTRAAREEARAEAELITSMQQEQTELASLRRKIEYANGATGERQALINELNNKYGQYLGFMVTEQNYLEQQDYIYSLLNAKIRENIALKMQEKMTDEIADKYAKPRQDSYNNLLNGLYKMPNVGKERAAEVMGNLMDAVQQQVKAGVTDVNAILMQIGGKDFEKKVNDLTAEFEAGKISGHDYSVQHTKLFSKQFGGRAAQFQLAVKKMIEVESDINAEVTRAEEIVASTQKANQKRAEEITKQHIEDSTETIKKVLEAEEPDMGKLKTYQSQTSKYVKGLEDELDGLKEQKKASKSLSYEELQFIKEMEEEMVDGIKPEEEARIQRYNELIKRQKEGREYTDDEKKRIEEINKDLGKVSETLTAVNKKIATSEGINIWGSPEKEDLAKNSPSQLVAMWDKLEKDASRLSNASFKTIGEFQEKNGKLMATQFWKNFDTREQATQWYINQKNAIAAQLKKLGYNTSGHFIGLGSGDGKSEAEEKARAEYRAVMAALEAHFLKRKQVIQDNYLQEKITGEEMNRQIADNEEAHLLARVELRKKLLGQANTFEQEKYEELAGRNIEQTGEFLRQKGDVVTDGIAKNLEQDEVKVREGAIKIRQAFEEELLKNDIFGKFQNNFRETLDKLELLSSDFERDIAKTISFDVLGEKVSGESIMGLDEKSQKKRLSSLIELSEKSYQINEQGMVDELKKNKEFANWIENLDADKKTVLLQQLRNYYDNVILLREQFQKRMEREFEGEYKQTGQQAEYDKVKKQLEGEAASREQLAGYGVRPDYEANREGIIANAANEEDKLRDSIDFFKERLDDFQKGSDEYIAIQDLIAQKELSLNELLAQSQRDLTQVYMDEWTKRAEKWGSVGEMFGEYLGEQLALEQQANAARARGDEETAKKLEQQQKQNQNNMIKNLLNFIVDEAALWAKEYALKMMFNALELSEEKKQAIEEVVLGGKKSMAKIATSAAEGQAEESKKGLPGLITGAIVFAATMALQAFVKSSIANMFPEASVGSTSNRKLSTGMLTYAEGNYPVLGNDGKVYDAKYEGAGIKTGVYGGGAHFGIFSEKQPEMIVDGKTTQKIILNYPYIYDAITTIAKNGRLVNAMPTFASGDYPAGMQRIAKVEAVDASANGSNEQMERTNAVLEQATSVIRELNKVLTSGQINASVDPYANQKATKRAERFMKRRGID